MDLNFSSFIKICLCVAHFKSVFPDAWCVFWLHRLKSSSRLSWFMVLSNCFAILLWFASLGAHLYIQWVLFTCILYLWLSPKSFYSFSLLFIFPSFIPLTMLSMESICSYILSNLVCVSECFFLYFKIYFQNVSVLVYFFLLPDHIISVFSVSEMYNSFKALTIFFIIFNLFWYIRLQFSSPLWIAVPGRAELSKQTPMNHRSQSHQVFTNN